VSEKTEKAFELIEALGEAFEPKESVCYVTYNTDVNHGLSVEEENCNDYCKDCIGSIVKQVSMKMESGEYKEPRDFVCVDYSIETGSEKQDFVICEKCGEIIECGHIWSMQEMEYWLGLSDKRWKEAVVDNRDCYQLMEILNPWGNAIPEYPKECDAIASKIIKFVEEKHG